MTAVTGLSPEQGGAWPGPTCHQWEYILLPLPLPSSVTGLIGRRTVVGIEVSCMQKYLPHAPVDAEPRGSPSLNRDCRLRIAEYIGIV